MNKGKILAIVSCCLWAVSIFCLFGYEVFGFNAVFFKILGICSLVAIVVFQIWFIAHYLKNHSKVLDLQEKYVDTLKPDKPLRFCPTDDELIKKHMEKIHITKSTNEKVLKENTNEDSVELELE